MHKGRLKAVPQQDLPLDIRIAAKRQRRTFNSWQLGLGPEVLYTPTSRPTHPSTLPPGAMMFCLPTGRPHSPTGFTHIPLHDDQISGAHRSARQTGSVLHICMVTAGDFSVAAMTLGC